MVTWLGSPSRSDGNWAQPMFSAIFWAFSWAEGHTNG